MKYKPLLNAPYGISVDRDLRSSGYHPVCAPRGYAFPSGMKQFFIVPVDGYPKKGITSDYLIRKIERIWSYS